MTAFVSWWWCQDAPERGHCGTNIAGMVDVAAVAKYVARLPNVVVSRDYKYMCSDPGQEMIVQDIAEHRLNRVVVAACSPLLHEHTFREATRRGGLNPFFFQMVNVREHDAWVHTDRALATRKAMALARAAIQRVPLHKPLEVKKVAINPNVLVVGGGIAGIHAALTLANAGKQVYLVEREPTIGGHMAKFERPSPPWTAPCACSRPRWPPWARTRTSRCGPTRRWPKSTATSATTRSRCAASRVTSWRTSAPAARSASTPASTRSRSSATNSTSAWASANRSICRSRRPSRQITLIDPETCIEFKTGKCKKTCVEACGDRKAIDFKQKEELGRSPSARSSSPPASRSSTRSACPTTATAFIPTSTTRWRSSAWSTPAARPKARSSCATARCRSGRHRPLRRLARREHQPVVLAGVLPVLAQARPPHQGAHRGRGLQLLHRHAHPRQRHGGVLQPHRRGRHAPHPRPGGRRVSRPNDGADRPAHRAGRGHHAGLHHEMPVDMVVLSVGLEPHPDARRSAACST